MYQISTLQVKELLSNEKDHFDKFEADWMPKT